MIEMLSPYKIRWQNMSSLELDLWTEISFDSDDGEIETYLNREAIASETYNGAFKRVYNYKWSDTFTPKITFIKQNYEDLTPEENRKVLTWLTSSSNAGFLYVYKDDSEAISFCILGNFTIINQRKLSNGRVIGYTAEFESISPFAFSPLHTVVKHIESPDDNIITINLETDEPQKPIYPRIIIQQNDDISVIEVDHEMTDLDNWIEGSVFHYDDKYYWVDENGEKHISETNDSNLETTSVSIVNTHTKLNSEPQEFKSIIKNNIKGEKITLDGANRVVLSSRINNRIFGDDFDWNWLPLYEGQNELSIQGNCIVTVEYRYPIKCGEF
jgi:hypothetical protein